MQIKKETKAEGRGVPTGAQLAAINAQAKAHLTEEQVYVFCLRLCDDQIDRDGERFDTAALPELARLFIGKTGILDHQWTTEHQVARIFEAQVVCENGVSYIKAWAYIRKGGAADEIIADIEAGIKKEVSVGCSMGRAVCSICGGEYGQCGHQKGEHYDGALCCVILKEPMDAYEFSFVAVPAQRDAGVLKAAGYGKLGLRELSVRYGAQKEYQAMYKQAQLGKVYEKLLQDEAVRLCLSLDLGVAEPVLRAIVEKAGAEDLMRLRTGLEEKLRERMPVQTQLPAGDPKSEIETGFLV